MEYQPGFRYSAHTPGSPAFFQEVEEHRYRTEPGILELVDFSRWSDRDVLELGCGIATDGVNLARRGAHYTGLDQSGTAVQIARQRFADEGLDGRIVQGSVAELPAADQSMDLVYSNGVLHHTTHTESAVREAARVLRPGGQALVMLYHKASLNYYINIMVVRRALAGLLLVPGVDRLAMSTGGEPSDVVAGHRSLLREHGLRYLTDTGLFLNHNTDGPGNPLSKVYTAGTAQSMFQTAGFRDVSVTTRFLNLRLYPKGEQLSRTRLARRLERRYGWHLWITATK